MKDIMAYDEAHYFDVSSTDTPDIKLGGVITEVSESSNPKESTKQYIQDKSETVNVTGYSNEFPITMDMVKGDDVFENFYEKFYERKTGDDLKIDHYIVNLWEQIEENGTAAENTYKCRKIKQTVSISECNGEAGAQKQINGSLKGGDFVYGTFNTSTKTFTANA